LNIGGLIQGRYILQLKGKRKDKYWNEKFSGKGFQTKITI